MTWTPRNLAHGGEKDGPVPNVSGVAYSGSRVLVSGEPESLKSWFAAVVAAERIGAGESVFWIDFEQGPAITRDRFADLGLTIDDLARVHYIEPREPLSDEGRAVLVDEIDATQPTVSVFDAYAGLLGVHDLDPNSERDIERVNRRVVDPFRDGGSAVLILDHVVKARENRSRYSSGNGRKLAEVEVHIGMERVKHFARGTTGLARLRNHKDRLGGLPHPLIGEFYLASDPTTFAVTWEIRPPAQSADVHDPTPFRPTFLMERVSRYLEQQTEPLSRTTVEGDVQGNGPALRIAMDRLVSEKYAASEDGPRNAKLLTSVRPYREADDPVQRRPDSVPTPSMNGDSDSVHRPLPIRQDGDRVSEQELERLQSLGDEMGLA